MTASIPRRRGSVYLIVLGAAMVVALLSLSSLITLRVQRRSVQGTIESAEARLYAQSAVELGLQIIAEDPAWRSTYSSGSWITDQQIGDGTFSLEGVDPADADLGDSQTDSLVLTGIGNKGRARQKVEVTLVPDLRGLSCLGSASHAGVNMTFSSSTTVDGTGTISVNDSMTATGNPVLNLPMEAVNSFAGSFGPGGTTSGVDPREMPDSATVLDYYLANGTAIDVNTLPSDAGFRKIELVVLSPAANPYGSGQTNAEGIYVVDCLSQNLSIQDCRIVGTLVLLNPGPGTLVDGSVNWQPAVSNYPALLVQGSATIRHSAGFQLGEGAPNNVNFNPTGTPYQGTEDSDQSDSYPSVIKGIVYVSGSVTLEQDPAFDGAVIAGGSVNVNAYLTLDFGSYEDNPPPGFETSDMKIVPGSWRRSVDP